METERYFAFISYKRGCVDEKVADWIHKKLEKYPYPKKLVDKENCPDDPERIRKVFIDTKELSITDKYFEDRIKECIKNSRYLILICSSKSSESEKQECRADQMCIDFVNPRQCTRRKIP